MTETNETPVTTPAASPVPAAPFLPPPVPDHYGQGRSKNPYLASALALFPGAGHIYNGLYMRAVSFFLIIATMIGLAGSQEDATAALFGFAVAFFWIFNVLDSYRQATLINLGLVHDLGLENAASVPKPGQSGIAAGILMFAIGLFATVDRFFAIDLQWVLELWPLALMAAGAWVAWSSVKERRLERDGSGFEEY